MTRDVEDRYYETAAQYIRDWRLLRVRATRILDLLFSLPIAYSLATIIGLAIVAMLGEDRTLYFSFWGVMWRAGAQLAACTACYKLLRLDRMDSLLGSWMKVVSFTLLTGSISMLLFLSAVHTETHNELSIVGLGEPYQTQRIEAFVFPVLIVGFQASLLMISVAPLLRKANTRRRQCEAGVLLRIGARDAAPLRECLLTALERVNVTVGTRFQRILALDHFEMVMARTSQATPSIVASDSGYTLIVPRGVIVLSRREPSVIIAMLAHELCHVLHGDVGLWHFEWLRSRVQTHRTVPAVAMQALSAALSLRFESLILFSFGVATLYSIRRAVQELAALRERSEHLADLGAFIATKGVAMLEAIQRFSGRDGSSLTSRCEQPAAPR